MAPFTQNSASFDPSTFFEASNLTTAGAHLQRNDLASAVTTLFALPTPDHYVYHANASVTLAQAQAAVAAGPTNGLHGWYRSDSEAVTNTLDPPPADITAYIALFDASKSAANSLKSLVANAKKGSLRASIAAWLTSRRFLDSSIVVPKRKATAAGSFVNPYFLFWSWSCHSLQYAGPNAEIGHKLRSHHVLPILMHHFACVCPSYEALEIIKIVAQGGTVLDVGSGTGYWTLMLRRQGCRVVAVDSQQSVYRTCWVEDTVKDDGVHFVSETRGGGKEDVLLLVYPIVSGDFTREVIQAFQGDTICVAGTQNGNGYTGFKDVVVDEWMEREKDSEWKMLARVPLPSFAGKDDALFVFKRQQV